MLEYNLKQWIEDDVLVEVKRLPDGQIVAVQIADQENCQCVTFRGPYITKLLNCLRAAGLFPENGESL